MAKASRGTLIALEPHRSAVALDSDLITLRNKKKISRFTMPRND
jgi:hypothetical protein